MYVYRIDNPDGSFTLAKRLIPTGEALYSSDSEEEINAFCDDYELKHRGYTTFTVTLNCPTNKLSVDIRNQDIRQFASSPLAKIASEILTEGARELKRSSV